MTRLERLRQLVRVADQEVFSSSSLEETEQCLLSLHSMRAEWCIVKSHSRDTYAIKRYINPDWLLEEKTERELCDMVDAFHNAFGQAMQFCQVACEVVRRLRGNHIIA